MAALIVQAVVVLSWVGVKLSLTSWKWLAARGRIKSSGHGNLYCLVQHWSYDLKTTHTASAFGICLVKGFAQRIGFPSTMNKC